MKTFKALAVGGLFLVLAMGCSSTADKESMLKAAGFKTIPANTPERQAHLRSLPADKITQVQGPGVTYYTFPDAKQNMLYVGQEPQYQEYQRLRLEDQEAMQQELNVSRMDEDYAWWGVAGPWGGQFWAAQ